MNTKNKIANWIIGAVFAALIAVGWYLVATQAESTPCVDKTEQGMY